jgi:hypothetical protein
MGQDALAGVGRGERVAERLICPCTTRVGIIHRPSGVVVCGSCGLPTAPPPPKKREASVVPCHPDRVRRNYAPELKPIDYIMAALAEHQNKCVDCGGAGCNYAAVAIERALDRMK